MRLRVVWYCSLGKHGATNNHLARLFDSRPLCRRRIANPVERLRATLAPIAKNDCARCESVLRKMLEAGA